MNIYRLEHLYTKLDPWEYNEQVLNIIDECLYTKTFELIEMPILNRYRSLYKNKIKFGFITLLQCLHIIRNKVLLQKHDFIIIKVEVKPIYISINGLVLYIEGIKVSDINY